jgi:putative CocE/NonD family hydrolase
MAMTHAPRPHKIALALSLAVACAAPAVTSHPPAPVVAPDTTPAVPRTASARPFDDYVGQYAATDAAELVLSVYADSGRKWFQPTDNPAFELVAAGVDTFDVPTIKHRLAFERDASGRVTGVRVRGGGGFDHPVAPRISDRPNIVRFVAMTRTDTMIAMRDGTRLHTVIVAPSAAGGPLPIVLERTPYGVAHWDPIGVNVALRSLVADGSGGYIFVFQDIRGRFSSEGHFEMIRPPREAQAAGDAEPAVDESTDAWDTIDWLVRHVPGNNGRVGIRGISYNGWLATMALRNPHPALRAASPQAPVGDLWRGDDFFHNGAFRLSYGYEFATLLESSRGMTEPKLGGEGDAYDWYLRLRSLAALDSTIKGKLPTWTAFVAHPSYDGYWHARDVRGQINRSGDRRVPTLIVGGRWDQEDPLGPLVTYATLERGDSLNMNTLVLGPWHHGQWSMGSGQRLGALDWGTQTGRFFRDSVEAPWFAHWLKDAPAPALPEALVFRSGENKWERLTRWPATGAGTRALFLRDSGALAFDAPRTATLASDSYVSDPANPVPYRARPIKETFGEGMVGWWTWLAEDQRFLGDRRDVLHWQTPALTEDVTVTGDVVATLFASTTGRDADWVVKLIDVYPDSVSGRDSAMAGYQLMVAGDILRGRYRRSLDRPMPVKAGAVETYPLTLRSVDHTFRRGHRIMVQVQSSWFPLYDRNPQTWVPNIFTARASDFRAATHRVYRTARYPSRVELPVVAP